MAHLSHDEKLNYTNFFLSVDEELGNGDGALDIDEFEKLLAIANQCKCSKDDVAAAFVDTDTDGNRKITLDEFLAKLPDMTFSAPTRSLAATIKSKFKELDVNQDGFVTYEQMREGLAELYDRVDEDMFEKFINEWDKDRNRKLNFQEFVVVYAEILTDHKDDGVSRCQHRCRADHVKTSV